MKNKNISVIFTGGTISMERDASTKKITLLDGQKNLVDDISSTLSNITIDSHYFSMKPSPSMQIYDMHELAILVDSKLADDACDGIVITHGTDTLEETAYFLDLFLATKKPVVITGSMRNYSALGYDGLSNLVSSVLVASDPNSNNRGVLVVLNDEINAASEVTKSHTLSLDTFKSLEFGPIGIIDEQAVLYYRQTHNIKRLIRPTRLVSNVGIVKAYAGSDSLLLNFLIDNKVKGIVIEALGRGNVPPLMVEGIERAISLKIPVVITSRCPIGRVLDSYAYNGGGDHLKSLGVIFANNINSQKARIQLILATSLDCSFEDLENFF